MRTSADVLRSLKRVMFLALPGYEIRFDGEEGVKGRPRVVIESSTGNQLSGPFHSLDNIEGFTIYVYPLPGENVQDSRIKANGVKERVEQALAMGVVDGALLDSGIGRPGLIPLYDFEGLNWKQGIDPHRSAKTDGDQSLPTADLVLDDASKFMSAGLVFVGDEPLAYTSHDDTTLHGVEGGETALASGTPVVQYGDRRRPDYAKVNDLSVQTKQSPDDERLYTVLAEVRLGWRRGRLLPSNADKVKSVRVSFE